VNPQAGKPALHYWVGHGSRSEARPKRDAASYGTGRVSGASCRQNEIIRDSTLCRQDAGSTLVVATSGHRETVTSYGRAELRAVNPRQINPQRC
jgi:hypothetical protein